MNCLVLTVCHMGEEHEGRSVKLSLYPTIRTYLIYVLDHVNSGPSHSGLYFMNYQGYRGNLELFLFWTTPGNTHRLLLTLHQESVLAEFRGPHGCQGLNPICPAHWTQHSSCYYTSSAQLQTFNSSYLKRWTEWDGQKSATDIVSISSPKGKPRQSFNEIVYRTKPELFT